MCQSYHYVKNQIPVFPSIIFKSYIGHSSSRAQFFELGVFEFLKFLPDFSATISIFSPLGSQTIFQGPQRRLGPQCIVWRNKNRICFTPSTYYSLNVENRKILKFFVFKRHKQSEGVDNPIVFAQLCSFGQILILITQFFDPTRSYPLYSKSGQND